MSLFRYNRFFLLFIFLGILLGKNTLHSQSLSVKVDSILQSNYPEEGSGIGFLIAKNGKAVYRKAYGLANLELNVPLSPESVFQIGSMTKQFTAVAILMLNDQGKLALTDQVSKYIPDYPNGDKIDIHHLLTHTSGIKDFTKIKAIREIATTDLSPKELVAFFKDEPVDFEPGSQFQYNNSGYVLLGYLIELISEKSYEDFIEQDIFQKLGMKDSRYANDSEVIRNRAYGYHQKGEWRNKMHISFNIPYASGALMSTLDDMLRWQNALNGSALLPQETLQKAFTPYSLNDGAAITYGYGWHIKEIGGTPTREHGGSIFGFKSMGVYFPEQDLYVLGFTNCDCISPTQLSRDIAELALTYYSAR